jgi:copper chaperone CopZ
VLSGSINFDSTWTYRRCGYTGHLFNQISTHTYGDNGRIARIIFLLCLWKKVQEEKRDYNIMDLYRIGNRNVYLYAFRKRVYLERVNPKVTVNLKTIIISLFIVLSMILLSACANNTESANLVSASETTIAANVESAEFKVTGMYCASCPFVVKSAVNRVKGVQSIEINEKGSSGTVKVKFDNSKTDLNSIKQTVLDLGYGVDNE